MSTDFVLYVEVFIVRKCQRIAINFDKLSSIEPIVLRNQWFDFLLEGLNIKLHLFAGLLDFSKKTEKILYTGSLIVRERQKAPNFDKQIYFNSFSSITTSLIFFTTVATGKYLCVFLREFGFQNYHYFSCKNIVVVRKAAKFYNVDLSWFSISSSSKQSTWFFHSRSQSKSFFTCIALLCSNVLIFFPVVEFWWTGKVRKCCLC